MALPVSTRCPQCGCADFTEVRPEGWISYRKDRVCNACQCRYVLPTPAWTRAVFVVCGALLIAAGGPSAAICLRSGNLLGVPMNVALAALGVSAIAFAERARREQLITPPDWQGGAVPTSAAVTPVATETLAPNLRDWVRFTLALFALVAFGALAALVVVLVVSANQPSKPTTEELQAQVKAEDAARLLNEQLERPGGGWPEISPRDDYLHLEDTAEHLISDDELSLVGDLGKLARLRIRSGQVTDKGVAHLGRLKHLELLELRCPRVTEESAAHLAAIETLRTLELGRSSLGDAGAGHLIALPRLTALDLSRTPITDAGARSLRQAQSLKELRLNFTHISDDCMPSLAGIATLQGLELRGCALSTEAIGGLARLPRLRKLVLDEIQLGDEAARILGGFRGLTKLYLTHCGISASGIEQIRRSLPDCQVDDHVYSRPGMDVEYPDMSIYDR